MPVDANGNPLPGASPLDPAYQQALAAALQPATAPSPAATAMAWAQQQPAPSFDPEGTGPVNYAPTPHGLVADVPAMASAVGTSAVSGHAGDDLVGWLGNNLPQTSSKPAAYAMAAASMPAVMGARAVDGVTNAMQWANDVQSGKFGTDVTDPASQAAIMPGAVQTAMAMGAPGMGMAEDGALGVAGGRLKQPATLERKLTQQAVPAYPGDSVVPVDVAKVDALWKREPDFYVDPSQDGPGSKLDRAADYMKALGKGQDFKPPQLGVGPDSFGFDDGRHRFAAMRDLGLMNAPVSMDPQSLENARALGLIADQTGATSAPATQTLNKAQRQALLNYSGGHFGPVNTYLRDGEDAMIANTYASDKVVRRQSMKTLDGLDSVFANASLPEATTVWRGTDLPNGTPAVGDVIGDRGFMSTSSKQGVAQGYADGRGGQMIEMQIPQGAPAVRLGANSHEPNSGEIVLNRNARMRVTGVDGNRVQAELLPYELWSRGIPGGSTLAGQAPPTQPDMGDPLHAALLAQAGGQAQQPPDPLLEALMAARR